MDRHRGVVRLQKMGKISCAERKEGFMQMRDGKPVRCVHVVQPGESYSSISQRHFGNQELWPIIWIANGREPSPSQLKAGTPLDIFYYKDITIWEQRFCVEIFKRLR
jgi:hypothetical protein